MPNQPHLEELTEEMADSYFAFVSDDDEFAGGKVTPAAFKKFVKTAESDRMDWRPKAKKTSVSRYVLRAKNGTIVARGILRFPLDEKLENDGGNLWVEVPPELRRQGFGSYCLSLLLFEAVRAGLRRAFVTCPTDDKAARKMIEKNRGEHQDDVPSKARKGKTIARYWIRFG